MLALATLTCWTTGHRHHARPLLPGSSNFYLPSPPRPAPPPLLGVTDEGVTDGNAGGRAGIYWTPLFLLAGCRTWAGSSTSAGLKSCCWCLELKTGSKDCRRSPRWAAGRALAVVPAVQGEEVKNE